MHWLIYSILIFFFTYLGQESVSGKKCIYFRALLVVVLAYIIGFGGKVVTDHENYAKFYQQFDSIDDFSILNIIGKAGRFEYGFMFLAQIGKFFGLGVPGFLFMVAVFVNSLMVSVLYRFKYPILSILMFISTAYFAQQANGVRQMIATAIFLYSLKYLIDGKIAKYLVGVFLAATCHVGAISLILLSLLYYVDLEKKFETIKIIIGGVWLVSLLGVAGLLHFETAIPTGAIGLYENFSEETGDYGTHFNVFYNSALLLALLGFKKKHVIYLIVYAIGCILLNISMGSEFGKSIYRYAYYFTPFFCMFSGELLFKANYLKFKYYTKPLMTLFVLYYTYRLLSLQILYQEEGLVGIDLYPLSDFFA